MNELPTIWRQYFQVRTREVNTAGHLKLSAVADYLQEAAANHTHNIKIGLLQLKAHNLTWILSRLRIDMLRYPGWGEKLTVVTWPKGDNHLAAARDFLIEDEAGQPVAKATSIWFLIDLKAMRPRPIAVLPTDFKVDHSLPVAISETPEKVPSPADCPAATIRCSPQSSDIDLNGHVNNACYFDWISNSIPPDNRLITRIDINYLAEIKAGDTVAMNVVDSSDSILLQGTDEKNGRAAFRARLFRQ